jgi:predicted dehydrogenase/threonine dehydrogenase-like Zn-dependent dehydrogenase
MRAVLRNLQTGCVNVYSVPEPELRPGGILVRTAFSAISSGTERATLNSSSKSIVERAMARPDLVKDLFNHACNHGVKATYDKIRSRLGTLSPLGYSCSGIVQAIGQGVAEFQPGDRVACGGSGYANHSLINWVPRNLAVRLPASVSLKAASLTTIGAIAMQGLRQAQMSFGESVIVIGAGLVGVLAIQLARAAGCRVIAVDLNESRVQKAKLFGAHMAVVSSDPRLFLTIKEFSRYGVDAAIVTAASDSTEPLELAAKVVRDRARVVIVGDVNMGVSRNNVYHKELSLMMSRSYGPGRYDPGYEEAGNDYPIGYVRWTERRNMEAFLDLLSSRALDVSRLVEDCYAIDDVIEAYQEVRNGERYTCILEYPPCEEEKRTSRAELSRTRPPAKEQLRIGCVGAGGFAQSQIFPSLKAAGARLQAIATASGLSAESIRQNFGFDKAETPGELLLDAEIDAVFIASRHESHAEYVVRALLSGKATFVEKPLAIDRLQLEKICETYNELVQSGACPFLMVGFNRRFAPFTEKISTFFRARHEAMVVHARVNAGFIPRDHWVQQPSEGGRIIGELCHFIDWARYVVGVPIRNASAVALPSGSRYSVDNVSTTLTFTDGSIANLLYLANGDASVGKEYFEVFCEGSIARLDDFQLLELVREKKTNRFRSSRDKGHRREFEMTVSAIMSGKPSPIPFEEIVEVTEATFSVVEALSSTPVTNGKQAFSGVGTASAPRTPVQESQSACDPSPRNFTRFS